MKIVIDLRSLQNGNFSGVENFIFNITQELLALDKKNSYVLFYNSYNNFKFPEFNFLNAKNVYTKIPNKILNILFKFHIISLEKLVGDFDILFMPNLNLINKKNTKKLIVTVHDLSFVRLPEFYDIKRRFWHWFLNPRRLLTLADKIVTVSNYSKNDIIDKFNIPTSKIEVVYPGVDTHVLTTHSEPNQLRQVRNFYGLPKRFFLFLNTIEPRKNVINVVKAFEQFVGEEYLVIAGKLGWRTRNTLKQIKQSNKKNKIIYLGYVKESFKPALIKLSTAVLYPSFYEGFGFQVLEANALNVPAIASQVTSLPEIAPQANLLVNPQNIRDILLAMQVIANQPFKNSELNSEIAHQFSWKTSAEKKLKNLEAICV